MPALIFVVLWCATAAGSQILRWIRAVPKSASAAENRLFGLALGLVLLAYEILFVGALGHLSPFPICACVVALGIIGFAQHRSLFSDIAQGVLAIRFTATTAIAGMFFLYFVGVALVGCFTPPTSLEYDSLTYHLADPKIFLAHHRIFYIPWEHHSNFAFTMEMLYTLGLSLHSVSLAKLFHLTMAMLTVAAIYLIGVKVHSGRVGLLASLLFASLPIVIWESGTAYVDLGACAFATLSLLALIRWILETEGDDAWLRVCALMMAGMLSVKATSLVNAALFGLAILVVQYHRTKSPSKSIQTAVVYGTVSLMLGSVWYIKSWIFTGNPFFPFAYSVFGGRHWSTENALNYAHSQAEFGAGHRLIDLILAPWNLVLYLLETTIHPDIVTKPFNDYQTNFASLTPVFLASLFVPAFWAQKSNGIIKGLAAYGLLSLVIWFFLTQQVRYLLPIFPVYCILSAFVVVELWSTQLVARYALALLFVASLVFSCQTGQRLAAIELPMATGAREPGHPYRAMQFLNSNTPLTAGVAFYGEPRDFYCDRKYLWAEPGHGLVVPYDSMKSPADLRKWMLGHGFQYIYIDYSEAPIKAGSGIDGLVYGITAETGKPPVYQAGPVAIYSLNDSSSPVN